MQGSFHNRDLAIQGDADFLAAICLDPNLLGREDFEVVSRVEATCHQLQQQAEKAFNWRTKWPQKILLKEETTA